MGTLLDALARKAAALPLRSPVRMIAARRLRPGQSRRRRPKSRGGFE